MYERHGLRSASTVAAAMAVGEPAQGQSRVGDGVSALPEDRRDELDDEPPASRSDEQGRESLE